MTDGEKSIADDEVRVADEAAFRAELRALLRDAHDAGVDIEGGWECRNGDGHPDWDVVVAAVEKPEASE